MPRPPVITEQPQGTNVAAGTGVTLSVDIGPSILATRYQWEYSPTATGTWTPINAATNRTLPLPDVQLSQAGFYRANVLNAVGQRQSDPAKLGVLQLQAVGLAHPSVSRGANVTLTPTPRSIDSPELAWFFNGLPLAAPARTLSLTNVSRGTHAGTYRVTATPPSGNPVSADLTLEVDETFAKITTGPVVTNGLSTRAGSWGDFDQDGDLDLFVPVASGWGDARWHLLFVNQGDGTFTRAMPETVGSALDHPNSAVTGLWGDIDKDGLLDLYVSGGGAVPLLHHNDGTGRFNRLTSAQGGDLLLWGAGPGSFADYDNDGALDIYAPGGRAGNAGVTSRFYRNDGSGRFKEIINSPLRMTLASAISCAWADYNGDGFQDLLVCEYDSRADPALYLFQNDRQGSFTRITNSPVAHLKGSLQAGAWADYDNDGDLDLFIVNATGDAVPGTPKNHYLFRNDGDGVFTPVTDQPMVQDTGQSTAAAWGDFDNDGFLDLYVANIRLNGEWLTSTAFSPAANYLYHNEGDGTFRSITTGSLVSDQGMSMGATWADCNNDGFLDLFVANRDGGHDCLYLNTGNPNAWIIVSLQGHFSHSHGTGAKVRTLATYRGQSRWQMREINGGDGYRTGPPLYAHFGLGDAPVVDTLRIEWPSGIVQELQAVPPNAYYTIQEPSLRLESDPPYTSLPSPLPVLAVPTNSPVTFNTTFTPPGAQYRWFKNGVLIEDAQGPALVLPVLVAADAGTYYVEIDYPETLQVHGADPVTVSAHVTQPGIRLEIEGAPVFLGQLNDQSVSLGTDVTFVAPRHSGTRPLAYQWQKDGTDLDGATNAILVLTEVTEADAGLYQLRMSNPSGEATQSVLLEVDPTFRKITANPIVRNPAINTAGSWGDYDGDGNLDLYLPALSWGYPDSHDVLYRNLGGGTFEPLGSLASSAPLIRESAAAVWGDYDNDGHLDLFLSSFTLARKLFQNLHDGTFTNPPPAEIGDLARLMADAGGAAWADYDRDGYLDLAVTPWASTNGTGLWHNSAGQRFDLAPNSLQPPITAQSMSLAWGDYDGDGYPDLFIGGDYALANDSARLYRNARDGTFTPLTRLFGQDREALLSGAWADYDNDGDLDLFVVSGMANPNGRNRLYRNRGDGTFERITNGHPVLEGGYSWGAVWGDYNNDGFLDLYVANFNFSTPGTWGDPYPNYLYQGRPDGSFIKITSGSPVNDLARSAGASWADYNNDGFLDLLVANMDPDAASNLYEGIPNGNAWVKVQLNGTVSNRKGVGARVLVKARYAGADRWQLREIQGGDGFTHSAPLEAHFGLGDATQVDVLRIEWPSGIVQEYYNKAEWIDTCQTINEPAHVTPSVVSVSLGASATFRTRLSGTYQWCFTGTPIPGATGQELTLTGISVADAGRYAVEITTPTTRIINPVRLEVDSVPFTLITSLTQGSLFRNDDSLAVRDLNDDGFPDLLVFPFDSEDTIFLNNQRGSFLAVPGPTAILTTGLEQRRACWGDYDNDGLPDLAVAFEDRQLLKIYHNEGDLRFTEVFSERQLNRPHNPAWGDYNQDGYLDLFVPLNLDATDRLYRNNGDGTFHRVTSQDPERAIVHPLGANSISGDWADYDNDGDIDLMVVVWGSTKRLFQNQGNGTFVLDASVPFHSFPGEHGAWIDFDNDGDLDIYITNNQGQDGLYEYLGGEGSGRWSVVSPQRGGDLVKNNIGSFIATWGDYDNDGDLDCFIDNSVALGGRLYRNDRESGFTRVFCLLDTREVQRCLWLDYDNDGDLDLLAGMRTADGASALLQNEGNGNHWLKVRCIGTTSNRDAIGTKVRARATIRGTDGWQLRSVSSSGRMTTLEAHFGLGDATQVDVLRIEWPSGIVQELQNIPANQMLTVTEPRPQPLLSEPRLQSDGMFQFTVLSDAGKTNLLEQSYDLTHWTVLGTPMVGATNLIEIQPDAQSPGRFYRVREEGGP